MNLENQFQIFISQKSDFLRNFWFAQRSMKITYHAITFEPCSQNL